MKKCNQPIILLLTLISFCTTVYAQANVQVLTVPFQNFSLLPNQTIIANYSFAGHPIILCFENNFQTVGVFYWPYKGVINQSTLPITLVTSASFQGQFADASGQLTIINNQNHTLITNCQYAF